MKSIPVICGRPDERELLAGEPLSPIDPDPRVCRFFGRCPRQRERCRTEEPAAARDRGGPPGGVPLRMTLPYSLDLASLARDYASGALTPAQVVSDIYAAIASAGALPVWIHLAGRDEALAAAAEVEKARAAGAALPLYGIPFAVKDNIDVAGLPTTAACPAFARIPRATAQCVRRLQDAGALVIGKTNLDQFATGLTGTRSPYGACVNPFDPRYIAGGSSSGSAVAVATGQASFALGTDTAGSGRVPAGFTNIVGLKPTRGLIGASGVVPACRSLDCVSILALTCDDARAVFEAARGYDALDPWSRAAPATEAAHAGAAPRFGVPRDPEFHGDAAAREHFERALELLARQRRRRRAGRLHALRGGCAAPLRGSVGGRAVRRHRVVHGASVRTRSCR